MAEKILTRDQILKADDLKTQKVAVPEWGGSVLVRTLRGKERDRFEEEMIVGRGKDRRVNMENLRAKLVVLTVVDESGNPLFKPDDVKALGEKSGKALDRIFEVAQNLSGLQPADIEEMTKNS